MNSNLKVAFYAIAGLAVGVGIGILFAPGSGKDTRQRVKYAADTLRKKIRVDGEDFSDSELEMDATSGRSFDA